MQDGLFNEYDLETAKIIDDFLPVKLFDAHTHISHLEKSTGMSYAFDKYYEDIKLFAGDREVCCNGIIFPDTELKAPKVNEESLKFLCAELDRHPQNVGEIIVFPKDTAEEIKNRLIHNRIRGLKCYHSYADRKDTLYADIEEYLPESAWQVANDQKLAITLHLVKDEALSHPGNLNYIINMSKKYPEAVLILAHAARAFAPWTVFGAVDMLTGCENVWFDFSAVCESPAMLYIIKKIGISRCMWGTDYPICMTHGKPVSIADSFYWIDDADLKQFMTKADLHSWHIITEEFMAMRQTAILADLNSSQIEDLFYNNADKLFNR